MKRLILIFMMLAFMAGFPTSLLANSDGYQNASQFCKANDNLSYKNHGLCVSIANNCYKGGNKEALCLCKTFLSGDPEEFYSEYNNLGECINHIELGYVTE